MSPSRLLPVAFSLDTRPAPRKRSGRLLPFLAFAALGGSLALGATFVAIHQVQSFGPWLADSLRRTIGSENVTRLEEAAAAVEDHLRLAASNGEVRSLDAAVALSPSLTALAPPLQGETAATVRSAPPPVGPLFHGSQSPSDGSWRERSTRSDDAVIYETMLHPDEKRRYAELFVYALDLSRFEIEAIAGSIEPRNPDLAKTTRPGVVPEGLRPQLVAAFNGGFKAEHGHYGMMSQGTQWLAPRPQACTFAVETNGKPVIATWSKLSAAMSDLRFFRQTPACMIEDGKLHPGLSSPGAKGWGATLDGETVIRRSALGLSEDGQFLFYAMSNATTARAVALGLRHLGATNVAQLDVNHSYPKFLLYAETTAGLSAEGAVDGLLYQEDEYLGQASSRDFFAVLAKD